MEFSQARIRSVAAVAALLEVELTQAYLAEVATEELSPMCVFAVFLDF